MSDFEKAWRVTKENSCCDSPRLIERQDGSTRCRNCQQSKVSKEEELPPEAPLPTSGEGPIEEDDPCPHCGASPESNPTYDDRFQGSLSHPDNPNGAYREHEIIDYGLDGDYYQKYQCFICSGEWENRYSFSGVVKR